MRTDSVAGLPLWTHGRARLALVLVHLPVFAILPINVLQSYVTGAVSASTAATTMALAVVLAVLQMRTDLALAEDRRPRHVAATVCAVAVAALLLVVLLGWTGTLGLFFLMATVLLLLPVPAGVTVCVAVLVMYVYADFIESDFARSSLPTKIEGFAYNVLLATVVVASMVGSTRLVRLLDELHTSRVELAEMSVTAERLRIARDLHDLLGQSLTAVSLKGDLAAALLDRDRARARAEIESLTETARTALRDVRAVASAPEAIRLATELDGASTLLGAAGIDVTIDVDLGPADEVDELGWVIREGVTNIVRHSAAEHVTITGRRRADGVGLVIRNDGAGPAGSPGSGLDGLRARIAARGGNLAVSQEDGWFQLAVDIPHSAPGGGTP
ncbi:sensor histidine kinase [Pseudonocardia sp. CA-107938]|uniref:sensor histidine kinase n=1 Tax=Pseudonocardia sp. CA-107938 TaxID=3240021 RepID=UPI003D9441AD